VIKKDQANDDMHKSEVLRTDIDAMEGKPLSPLFLTHDPKGFVVVEEQEFNYTYMCKHCGHQWMETHRKTGVEPSPEGYTGD
jgi:hypothetical protein